ncbi:30S ribosomal protein S16 [Candidatus Daviesbacteria bacterium RIFCSPHIGHO2_12_FULL_37_11]|uniref:Small ribosomal subunit protein bS16 n=1 Tax=Candidatus Daviesbacteria bacterium RIFCSPHIGHO2_12_FULL_37_11 TaxID=1797777 RepID=A0A1F5KBR8_9BACT|nr:MAG: 30S ribosomal protein S16 [Candidatus Daviesbacteria bacterium GWA1_38_6]OGE38215.1 MAG: 30S ribosomal protein S16 [Candidatus Daviesbacteria bacterium RIFCSPHIGHO2_12_FULL_37_11]OGE45887.1 MAG: 30S ribosomal protein S16 [Candidatus Daviesbacteria bacterium RIFCSPLOWO2_01_FULL_37_10]
MLKIRLMRIGAKKRPFYRVVAVDERAKRTGGYLELLGTYNPLTNPHEIKLNQDKIDSWIKKGAKLSDGFLRITGKAPQKPPRKPKKEKVAEAPVELKPTESADTSGVSKETEPEASTEPEVIPEEQAPKENEEK